MGILKDPSGPLIESLAVANGKTTAQACKEAGVVEVRLCTATLRQRGPRQPSTNRDGVGDTQGVFHRITPFSKK